MSVYEISRSVIAPPVHLTSQESLSQFLSGQIDLSRIDLIALLKQDPHLSELYSLSAGVGEEYTVEEHTRMVLDSFIKEFAPQSRVQEILVKCNLTKNQFVLFLALHDIGKGRAVQEIPEPSRERKKLELAYTLEEMERYSNQWGLQDKIPLFKALLLDDAVGDYIKIKGPWYEDAKETAEHIRLAAEIAQLDRAQFFELKVLFHQVDSGSYPFLRYQLFSCSRDKVHEIGSQVFFQLDDYAPHHSAKIRQLSVAVKSVKIDDKPANLAFTFKTSSEGYTLTEIAQLKTTVKQIKQSEGVDSEHYLYLKTRLVQLEERYLPFRGYRCLKMGNGEVKGVEPAFEFPIPFPFTSLLPPNLHPGRSIKQDSLLPTSQLNKLRTIKKKLREESIPETLENKFQFLSKLTFVHGSNSAALVLMHLRDRYRLECSGDLNSQGVAPMSGKFDIGVSSFGINIKKISVETVRDIDRARHHATAYPFKPDDLEHLKNPLVGLLGLFCQNDRSRRIRLNAIGNWKTEQPEEFEQLLGKGSLSNQLLLEVLEKALQKGTYHGKIKDDISSVIASLKSEKEWPVFLLDPSLSIPEIAAQSQFLSQIKKCFVDPFRPHVEQDAWFRTALELRQLQQWDHVAFEKEVLSNRDRWLQSIQTVRTQTEKQQGLRGTVAILNYPFTEAEQGLISQALQGNNFPEAEISEKLLELLDSLKEAPEHSTSKSYRIGKQDYDLSPRIVSVLTSHLEALEQKKGLQESGSKQQLTEMLAAYLLTKTTCEEALKIIEKNYEGLISALSGSSHVQIPDDPKIRSLVTDPFPILFSSTSVKPFPNQPGMGNEYNLLESVPLGKGGCDILITDTEESKQKIAELLTDELRNEIEIHLFDELDVGGFPLIHGPHQINQKNWLTKTYNISLKSTPELLS